MSNSAGVAAVPVDSRAKQPYTKPVWEQVVTFTLVSADTTGSATIPLNGTLKKVIYKRGDQSSNDDLTSKLVLTDNGDNTIFETGAGLPENDTDSYPVDEPIATEINIAITLNEAAGEAGTLTVTLRGI